MKHTKILCTLLFALILTSCAAGNSQKGETVPVSEAAVSVAEAVLQQLAEENFEVVSQRIAPELKDRLTTDMIKEGWLEAVAVLGDYQGIEDVTATSDGTDIIIQVTGQFTHGSLVLTCSLDQSQMINGLFIKPVPETQTDTANALPLPEGAQEINVTLFPGTAQEVKGVVVLPKDHTENTPAVVFAHGSGSSDMDETIGPNKPFRDLAYGLAAKGVASIRYDKLSYAHPELIANQYYTVDIEYKDAVIEAYGILRNTAGLGPVYILGHSLGGNLVPYFLEANEGNFAGGIIMAGTPREMWEISYAQNLAMLELLGDNVSDEDRALIELERKNAIEIDLDAMTEEERNAAFVFGLPASYVWHMRNLNLQSLAVNRPEPLLILQGEEDVQITMDDFNAWKELLSSRTAPVEFHSYPGLNHLFMAISGNILELNETYQVPLNVSEEAVQDIAAWIWNQQKKEPAAE